METQAISAPVERLTREAPKRQVGYGLPCAKCHKYFPADLEVCPICKGRERVSPVVAPRIRKPVQSETSAAPSSSNLPVKQQVEVKESPKSDPPALAPPVEIKANDQPLDHKVSITTPAVVEIPAIIELPHASLVSPQVVSAPREKESPKLEPAAFAPPLEIEVKDEPLDHKVSITVPVVAEIPAVVEPVPASLVSTQGVSIQESEESPSESPAVTPPIEIKVNDQLLDQRQSSTTPAFAEIPAAVEPARPSLVTTREEKESPKQEPATFVPPVEIEVENRLANQKEPIPTPVVAETPAAAEPAPPSLVSTQPVLTQEEKESPKLEAPALVAPVEIKVNDQPLNQKESIDTPAVAQGPVAAELVRARVVSTQKKKEKKSPKSESPASAVPEQAVRPVEVHANNQRPTQKEPIAIPALNEVQETIEPVADNTVTATNSSLVREMESPTITASVVSSVKDPHIDRLEPSVIPALAEAQPPVAPVAESRTPVQAEELPKELQVQTFSISEQVPVQNRSLNDQPNSDQPNVDRPKQEPRVAIPALVEAQASEPVPAAVTPMLEEQARTTDLDAQPVPLPIQVDTEEQRRDKINQALRIVIPMLVETQVSERAPVAAKQEVLEQEEKEQTPKMSEAPMSASEVKIAEAKPVASPAVVNQATHRPHEQKSKAIDKRVDAPPKPADVNAPMVVHVNLGELRAAKSAPERAPAQSKEIEYTEAETNSSDIASDADTLESSTPVGGRKLDLVTFSLGVVVLACAVLLITLAAIRLMPRHAAEPVRRAKAAYSSGSPTADENPNAPIPATPPATAAGVNLASSNSSPVVGPTAAPVQPPVASPGSLPSSAGSARVLTLSEGLAEGNLLYRVEPDYPEEARRQGVQGPVVLDLHISKDGLVQGVDLVSGQPLLAQAATAAVRQWRFRTRYVNGNEVEMQARITLHFALPTP
jgi:TonB family protein